MKLGKKLGKLGNAYKKSCTVLLPTVFFKGCILILKNLTTGTWIMCRHFKLFSNSFKKFTKLPLPKYGKN